MRVSVSLYALHLHATPFTVGVLMGLYALLPMLSAVSMGRLIDRIGARVPMLFGSVAIALGALVPYLWPTLTALHLTSVLIGSGFMMYQVAAQNIIGYIGPPEDRPMTFSLAALGFSVSGFVGPMLAGFGIDAFGHIATFGAFAAFPLLPIAVLGLNKLHLPQPHTNAPPLGPRRSVVDLQIGRPEDRPMTFSRAALGFSVSGFVGPMLAGFGIDAFGHIATFGAFAAFPLLPIAVLGLNKRHLPQPHTNAPPLDPRRSVVDLLRHRVLRHVFVASGLLAAAWDMFTFAIPIYGSRIGLSASSIGLVLGSFSVATFVIRGLLPAISRRLTAWPLLTVSLGTAATVFFLDRKSVV